jgi:multidrug efflux pump subunit AcrB
MNISALFIRRPIATSLLMAAIVLLGLIGYELLPIAALPEIDSPTIQVTAQLPGADPQTMASSVATQLERQFGEIPGLTQMTSSSALGYMQITLQFSRGQSIDSYAEGVQAAINATGGELPVNLLNPPIYRETNPADTPILLIALTSDTLPITKVSDYANSILAQKLSQVPGVGLASIGGEQNPAIRVQLNPAQLAAEGLDLESVRTALTNSTVNQPKGILYGGEHAYALSTNDQLLTASGFDDYILAYVKGAPVRIRDVGRAVVAPQDTTLGAWLGPTPTVVLAIQRQPGANVIETVDLIKKALQQLEASIPPSIKVEIVSDRTQTIRASVADVKFTLLLTIALVVSVIFIFLRNLWATVIPAVAVPLSLIGTFAVMYVLGYSLDNLSLMALTIAVGFVVDDAVVMIENKDRLYHRLDVHIADRSVHSALPDGRNRWPAVPRVCRDRRSVDRRLPHRIADADANDVRPPANAGARQSRDHVEDDRTLLQSASRGLRSGIGRRPAIPPDHSDHHDSYYLPDDGAVCLDTEGLLPAGGHRVDPWH